MRFYFPKEQFDNYKDVVRFDMDYDVRVSIMLHPDIKMLWKGFRSRLRGAEVELYSKSGDGSIKVYSSVKLSTSGAIDKILTAHIIFGYAGEIREMFDEFNTMCKNGVFVGEGIYLGEELGRCRLGFKTHETKIVMNISAYGILSMGKEYFEVVGPSLLFNYFFSRWIVENGEKYKWIEGKDRIINRCKYLCDVVFRPIIDDRLRKMRNIMEEYKGEKREILEQAVYDYFKEHDTIDVDRPTLEVYETIVKCGADINQFKKVVYELYKRGVLEAEGVECTFIGNTCSMPRKFRLKRK